MDLMWGMGMDTEHVDAEDKVEASHEIICHESCTINSPVRGDEDEDEVQRIYCPVSGAKIVWTD